MGGFYSGRQDGAGGYPSSCAGTHYSIWATATPFYFICIPNSFAGFYHGNTFNIGQPGSCAGTHYQVIQLSNGSSFTCIPNFYGGFYYAGNNNSTCAAGYYFTQSSFGGAGSDGRLCVPNTVSYSATPNTTFSCPSGYNNDGGSPPCVSYVSALSFSCPAGQYLSNQATDSCTPCPAGSYCTGGVGAGTTQCPANNYCLAGVSSPAPCPANTSSPVGTTSAAGCITNNMSLDLKAFLSGPFDLASISVGNPIGLMKKDLSTRNLLPTNQPFNVPGIGYQDTETLPTTNRSMDIVDWVLIEIRDANNVGLKAKAVVIMSDGTIKDSNNAITGNTNNSINLAGSGLAINTNYKLILRQLNHIHIATNTPISFDTNGQASLDFTTNQNVKGANQDRLGVVGGGTYNPGATPGATGSYIYGLRKGDASGDRSIDASDRNILNTSDEFDGVYNTKDLNLDAVIDATDRNISQNAGEAVENL